MAVESAEGTEDDTVSICSLFYSCMSTASEIANAADCDHEHDGAKAIHVFHGDGAIEGVAHGLPTSPGHDQYVVGSTAPSPSHPEIINCNTAVGRPPSDSSWSVPSEGERPTVRSITFNRDRTCLIICTSIGVRIRTLESLQLSLQDMDSENDRNKTNGNQITGSSSSWVHDVPLPPDGATYAQLLHSTSLLAVVKPSSPRCCYLFNIKNASSPLAALPLSAAIKRVELQRNVLAAMTVDLRLHVFHLTGDGSSCVNRYSIDRRYGIEPGNLRPILITTLNIMHPSDSPRNTRGIDSFNAGAYFDLSPGEEDFLICKSFNGSPGTIRVYDPTIVHTLPHVPSGNVSVASEVVVSNECSWDKHNSVITRKKVKRRIHFITSIDAHDHSVTRMLIGWGGRNKRPSSYLATTSCHGTRIRVFNLPKGENLWEWYRGSKSCNFYSLSWNGTADRLAAHGSSGTIHVFDWQNENPPVSDEQDDADEGSRDFNCVHETKNGQPRAITDDTSLASEKSKPFFHRFASSIKRHTLIRNNPSTPAKYRSFAKLKYKSSASSDSNAGKTQALVLSLLNRNHDIDGKNDNADIEDTLVVCSLDGELRRYLVKKSIEPTHVDDVLSRGYE